MIRTRAACSAAETRASKAETEKKAVETRHTRELHAQKMRYEGQIDQAQRENKTGQYGWTEIKFLKKRGESVSSSPRSAVKKGSAKLREVIEAALPVTKNKPADSWTFQWLGQALSNKDMDKTLTQVSSLLMGKRTLQG